MSNSIVDILEAIDEMADKFPDLGDRFVHESRKYWAAKKEVFDYNKRHTCTARQYPYMLMFRSLVTYQDNYGEIVYNTLLKEGLQRRIPKRTKELIKLVAKKFMDIEPDDNTYLPLVNNKGGIGVLLPDDKVIPIYTNSGGN